MLHKPQKSITFAAPRNGRAAANAIAHPKIEEGIEPSPILPRKRTVLWHSLCSSAANCQLV